MATGSAITNLHPENVLLGPRGPEIHRRMDANRGNPLADVGRTLLILRGWPYTTPNPAERLIRRGVIALCTRAYLARYLALRGLPKPIPTALVHNVRNS
jgi:hypothetical protein